MDDLAEEVADVLAAYARSITAGDFRTLSHYHAVAISLQ